MASKKTKLLSLVVSCLDSENLKQLEELCKRHGFKCEVIEDNPKQTLSEEFDSLKTIVDSSRVKAEKKAVELCYNKVVAKKKVPFVRYFQVVAENLSVLSKKEQQEFATLQSKVKSAKDGDALKKANIERQQFSKKIVLKYSKLKDIFIERCDNVKKNTATK